MVDDQEFIVNLKVITTHLYGPANPGCMGGSSGSRPETKQEYILAL